MNYEMFFDFYRNYKYNKQLLNGEIVQEKIKNVHPWLLLDHNLKLLNQNVIQFSGNKAMCFLNILSELNPKVVQKMKLGIDLSDVFVGGDFQFDYIQFNKILPCLVELHLEKYNDMLELEFLNDVFKYSNQLVLLNLSDMNLTNEKLKNVKFQKIPSTLKILNISENTALRSLSFINDIFFKCQNLQAVGLRNINLFFKQKFLQIEFSQIPETVEKIDLSFNQITNYKKTQLEFLNQIFRRCNNLTRIFMVNCSIVNYSFVPVNFQLLKASQSFFAKLDLKANKQFKSLHFMNDILDICASYTNLQLIDMDLNLSKINTLDFLACRYIIQLNLSQNRLIENFKFINELIMYAPNFSSLILEDVDLTQNKLAEINIQTLGQQLTELNISRNKDFDGILFLNQLFSVGKKFIKLNLSNINLNDHKMQYLAFETIDSPNLTSITITKNPIRKNFVRIFQLLKKMSFSLFINYEYDNIENYMFREFLQKSNESFEKTLVYQNLIDNAQEVEAEGFLQREERLLQQQYQYQGQKLNSQDTNININSNREKRKCKLDCQSPKKLQDDEENIDIQRDFVTKLEEEYMKGSVCYYDFEYEQASIGQWSSINLSNLKCLSDIDIYSCRKECLSYLVSLDLTGFSSLNGSFLFLNQIFLHTTSLKKLNLSKCNLTDQDVFSISFKSRSLEELNLSYNDQIQNFSFLNKILHYCQKLQVLKLQDMDLNDEKISTIDFKCLRFTKIKSLDFSQNYGIQDFEFLNEIFEHSKFLENLFLQDIDIVDEQVNQILFYKLKYTCLKKFVLSQNDQLTDFTFINLIFHYSHQLDHLIISYQDIYSDPNFYEIKQLKALETTHAVSQPSPSQLNKMTPVNSSNFIGQRQDQLSEIQNIYETPQKNDHILAQKLYSSNLQNQQSDLNQTIRSNDHILSQKLQSSNLQNQQSDLNQTIRSGQQYQQLTPQENQNLQKKTSYSFTESFYNRSNSQNPSQNQQKIDQNQQQGQQGQIDQTEKTNPNKISTDISNSAKEKYVNDNLNQNQNFQQSPEKHITQQENYNNINNDPNNIHSHQSSFSCINSPQKFNSSIKQKSQNDIMKSDTNRLNNDFELNMNSRENFSSRKFSSRGRSLSNHSNYSQQNKYNQYKDQQRRKYNSEDKNYSQREISEFRQSHQSKSSLKQSQLKSQKSIKNGKSQEDFSKSSQNVKWADLSQNDDDSQNTSNNQRSIIFDTQQSKNQQLIQTRNCQQLQKQDNKSMPQMIIEPQIYPQILQKNNTIEQYKSTLDNFDTKWLNRPNKKNNERIKQVTDNEYMNKDPFFFGSYSDQLQDKNNIIQFSKNKNEIYENGKQHHLQVISQNIQGSNDKKYYDGKMNFMQVISSSQEMQNSDILEENLSQYTKGKYESNAIQDDFYDLSVIQNSLNLQQFLIDQNPPFDPNLQVQRIRYDDYSLPNKPKISLEIFHPTKNSKTNSFHFKQPKLDQLNDRKASQIQSQSIKYRKETVDKLIPSNQIQKKQKEKKAKNTYGLHQRVIKTPVAFLNDIFQRSQKIQKKIEKQQDKLTKSKQQNSSVKIIDFAEEVQNSHRLKENKKQQIQYPKQQQQIDQQNEDNNQASKHIKKFFIQEEKQNQDDILQKKLSKVELDFADEFEQMVIENQDWYLKQQIKQQEEELRRIEQEQMRQEEEKIRKEEEKRRKYEEKIKKKELRKMEEEIKKREEQLRIQEIENKKKQEELLLKEQQMLQIIQEQSKNTPYMNYFINSNNNLSNTNPNQRSIIASQQNTQSTINSINKTQNGQINFILPNKQKQEYQQIQFIKQNHNQESKQQPNTHENLSNQQKVQQIQNLQLKPEPEQIQSQIQGQQNINKYKKDISVRDTPKSNQNSDQKKKDTQLALLNQMNQNNQFVTFRNVDKQQFKINLTNLEQLQSKDTKSIDNNQILSAQHDNHLQQSKEIDKNNKAREQNAQIPLENQEIKISSLNLIQENMKHSNVQRSPNNNISSIQMQHYQIIGSKSIDSLQQASKYSEQQINSQKEIELNKNKSNKKLRNKENILSPQGSTSSIKDSKKISKEIDNESQLKDPLCSIDENVSNKKSIFSMEKQKELKIKLNGSVSSQSPINQQDISNQSSVTLNSQIPLLKKFDYSNQQDYISENGSQKQISSAQLIKINSPSGSNSSKNVTQKLSKFSNYIHKQMSQGSVSSQSLINQQEVSNQQSDTLNPQIPLLKNIDQSNQSDQISENGSQKQISSSKLIKINSPSGGNSSKNVNQKLSKFSNNIHKQMSQGSISLQSPINQKDISNQSSVSLNSQIPLLKKFDYNNQSDYNSENGSQKQISSTKLIKINSPSGGNSSKNVTQKLSKFSNYIHKQMSIEEKCQSEGGEQSLNKGQLKENSISLCNPDGSQQLIQNDKSPNNKKWDHNIKIALSESFIKQNSQQSIKSNKQTPQNNKTILQSSVQFNVLDSLKEDNQYNIMNESNLQHPNADSLKTRLQNDIQSINNSEQNLVSKQGNKKENQSLNNSLQPEELSKKQQNKVNQNKVLIEKLDSRINDEEQFIEYPEQTQIDYTNANENSVLYQKNVDISQSEHNQTDLHIIQQDYKDDEEINVYDNSEQKDYDKYKNKDNDDYSMNVSQVQLLNNKQLLDDSVSQIIEMNQKEDIITEHEHILDNSERRFTQIKNEEQKYYEFLENQQDINFKDIRNNQTEIIELNNLRGDKVNDIIEQIIYNASSSLRVLKLENIDLSEFKKIDVQKSKLDLDELSLKKSTIPNMNFLNIIAGMCNNNLTRLNIEDIEVADHRASTNLSVNIFDKIQDLSLSGDSSLKFFQNSSFFNHVFSRCFVLKKLKLNKTFLDFQNIKLKHFSYLQSIDLSYNPNLSINFINHIISNSSNLIHLKINGISLTSERASQIIFERISLKIKTISFADNPIDLSSIESSKFLKNLLKYTKSSLEYFIIDHMFTQPYHILQRVCIEEDKEQQKVNEEKNDDDQNIDTNQNEEISRYNQNKNKEEGLQKKIKYRALIEFIIKNKLSAPQLYIAQKETLEDHIIDIIFQDRTTCENIILNDLILSSLIQTRDLYLQNRDLKSDILIFSPLDVKFQMVNYKRRFTLDMLAKFSSKSWYNTYNSVFIGNRDQPKSKKNNFQMLNNNYEYIIGYTQDKNEIFETFYKQDSGQREKTYYDVNQILSSSLYSHLKRVFLPLKLALKFEQKDLNEGDAIKMINFMPPSQLWFNDKVSNQFLKCWYCINYLSPLTSKTQLQLNRSRTSNSFYDISIANRFVNYYYSRKRDYQNQDCFSQIISFFLQIFYYFFNIFASHQQPFLFDFTIVQLNSKLKQYNTLENALFLIYFVYLLISVAIITLFNMLNSYDEEKFSSISINSFNHVIFFIFQVIIVIIDIALLNFLKKQVKTIYQRKMSFLKFKYLSIQTSLQVQNIQKILYAQFKTWNFYFNYCCISILYVSEMYNYLIPSITFVSISVALDLFSLIHSLIKQMKKNKKYAMPTYKIDRFITLTEVTNLFASYHFIKEYSPSNYLEMNGVIIDKITILDQFKFFMYNLPQTILLFLFDQNNESNILIKTSIAFNVVIMVFLFIQIISYNPTVLNQEMFDELNQKKKNKLINLYETQIFELQKYQLKKRHHETFKYIRFSQLNQRNEQLKLGHNRVIYKQYFESEKTTYQDLIREIQLNVDITQYFEQ